MVASLTGARTDLDILGEQRALYEGDFYRKSRWRWTFRVDCRYRWHRLREFLLQAGFSLEQRRVLEIGFGSGDLLFLFSTSCKLMGVELSAAAVQAVLEDPRLRHYSGHWFRAVDPDGSLPAPPEPADILITSHVLEHVPDDQALLRQALPALRPGGLLVAFVPVESPGFDPKHVRCYSAADLGRLVQQAGLELLHVEENYQICCGPVRWADHPARHQWPLLKGLEGLRNVLMTPLSYETIRTLEGLLVQWGVPGTQAMVVARKG